MKKRKILSLILTICMVLSLTPIVAYAEDAPIFTKCFGVSFNPGGVDEQTEGKVQVQIGDEEPWFAEVDKDYFYTDGATPITFTLTPPAEGVGYTPDVIVMDGSLASVQPVLQENEGKYSFSIAPNAISGIAGLNFVVWVSWCPEFDSFGPEDGQFMVETHVRGGEANGSVLIQPGTEKHKSFGSNDKYLFTRRPDANTLNVTFIPQPGIKLVAFRIGDQMYGDEPVDGFPEEEMHPLPELRADGQCTMTISVPALSDTDADEYIFVEAIFEAAYPVTPPAGLRWDGKIAKWDAVEGADHYRITLFRGYTDSNGETVWHGTTANSGIITEACAFDYSGAIDPNDYSNNYFFRVCAIKDKVCSDEVESDPYASITHTHVAGTEWKSDADNHWHICSVDGCGAIIEGSKTAHSYGDDNVCDICGYTKPVTPPSYSIIEGANGVWTQNTDGTLTVRADGDFSKFTGVKVDDTLIDAKNYTAVSGSTIVTLKADYLKTLSVGTHKLTVVYNDGECSTNFEVKAAQTQNGGGSDSKKSPQTGDNSNRALWFVLLCISCAGAVGTIYSRKKKYSEK